MVTMSTSQRQVLGATKPGLGVDHWFELAPVIRTPTMLGNDSLASINVGELLKLIQDQRLPSLLKKLSGPLSEAAEERQKFARYANSVGSSIAELQAMMSQGSGAPSGELIRRMDELQSQLQSDSKAVSKQVETTQNVDLNLGNLEKKFGKNSQTVVNIISELLRRTRVEDPEDHETIEDGESSQSRADASTESTQSLDSAVLDYYDAIGNAKLVYDTMVNLEKDKLEALTNYHRLQDQETPLPYSEADLYGTFASRKQNLETECKKFIQQAEDLREQCADRGIDVEDSRYRMHDHQSSKSNSSIPTWLDGIHPDVPIPQNSSDTMLTRMISPADTTRNQTAGALNSSSSCVQCNDLDLGSMITPVKTLENHRASRQARSGETGRRGMQRNNISSFGGPEMHETKQRILPESLTEANVGRTRSETAKPPQRSGMRPTSHVYDMSNASRPLVSWSKKFVSQSNDLTQRHKQSQYFEAHRAQSWTPQQMSDSLPPSSRAAETMRNVVHDACDKSISQADGGVFSFGQPPLPGSIDDPGNRLHIQDMITPNRTSLDPFESQRKYTQRYNFHVYPREYFTLGKVFLTTWSEPAKSSSCSSVSGSSLAFSQNSWGEWIYSKIQRFVIVKKDSHTCTAVPVNTYGGYGVAKKGVTKSNHAIIYTGRTPPLHKPQEEAERGESGLLPRSIRVDAHPSKKLDTMSRIDFAKPHTISYDYKIEAFGQVNPSSMQHLLYQWRKVNNRDADLASFSVPGPSWHKQPPGHRSSAKNECRKERATSTSKDGGFALKNEGNITTKSAIPSRGRNSRFERK